MSNESISSITTAEYKSSRPEAQPINTRTPFKVRAPNPDATKEAENIATITGSFNTLIENAIKFRKIQEAKRMKGDPTADSKGYTDAKIGQKIISNYSSCLAALGIGHDISKRLSPEQIKAIRSLNSSISKAYTDPQEKDVIIKGILGEYATYIAINEAINRSGLPYQIVKPSQKEDFETGTDLILQRKDQTGLIPIQVKSLLLDNPPKLIHPLGRQSTNSTAREILEHSLRNTYGSGIIDNKIKDVEHSANSLLSFSDNDQPVLEHAMIAIPSPTSETSMLNSLSGIPSEKFIDQIGGELYNLTYGNNEGTNTQTPTGTSSILQREIREPAFGDD